MAPGIVNALVWVALSSASGAPADTAAPAKKDTAPEAPAPTAKKDITPAETPKARLLEGMGKTPQEEALLDEVSQAIQSYEAESKDFKHEVQLLIEKKYDEKRNL